MERRSFLLDGLTDLMTLNLARGNNMGKKISEVDVTWSSIEKGIKYNSVAWSTDNNGIPRYTFFDEDGKRIKI